MRRFLGARGHFPVGFGRNALARPAIPLVDTNFLDKSTTRQSYADLVRTGADLSDFDCYICHDKKSPPPLRFDTNQNIIVATEHTDIVMGHGKHGRNNNCFNCHNETNLTLLQPRDGRELTFADSSQLCGSCHGPTYRDWLAGAHGRISGYWDRGASPSSAEEIRDLTKTARFQRKDCVNCHNPHSPPFPRESPRPARIPCGKLRPRPVRRPAEMIWTYHRHRPPNIQCRRPARWAAAASWTSAVLTTGLAALAASLKPLLEMNDFPTMERFLQKYYKEMTPQDMDKVLKRIEDEVQTNTACARMCGI